MTSRVCKCFTVTEANEFAREQAWIIELGGQINGWCPKFTLAVLARAIVILEHSNELTLFDEELLAAREEARRSVQ